MDTVYASVDVLIIGGGINGAGIARDAAGRGLSVVLAEKGDLASATSSSSTKLVHGGLRYLEHYEFRLVREALKEREVLLRAAPHIIWPLRFVLPHHRGLRPAWLLRLGLFIYDHLGGRALLPGTRMIDLTRSPVGAPLKPEYRLGFEYSDCWVEDTRLVVLNAMDAQERGAEILTRTALVDAKVVDGVWVARLLGPEGERTVRARTVVNAAGPWVADVLGERLGVNTGSSVRLVKGSHIVVPQLYEHDRCYIFQNSDGRIIFSIPYEGAFTLIGTTDEDYQGDPGAAAISDDEIAYLCRLTAEYFQAPVTPADVVWTYSGVRPLYDDGASKAQEATRDYVLEWSESRGAASLSVFGGKITTFRRLAEAAMDHLKRSFPKLGPSWTSTAPLPGGDFEPRGVDAMVGALRERIPDLGHATARRLVRAYGTRVWSVIGKARCVTDLGAAFGADLTEAEVRYLMDDEWAQRADDVVWRRTKLGLRMAKQEIGRLDDWMVARRAGGLQARQMTDRAVGGP
ncbi:glycerol-3-phosphate dehydrogenase [alpha proteobacterium BAL199]|nr:glycerol-3-phosphate dehydrogenase [alpha proteobacterium BAL199]